MPNSYPRRSSPLLAMVLCCICGRRFSAVENYPRVRNPLTHQTLYDFEIEFEGLRMVKHALWAPDPDWAFIWLRLSLRERLGFRVPSESDVSFLQVSHYEPKEGPVLISWVEAGHA
tara:strand:+ start:77 stop:424 length:348 start_codon:yes stop_codon:yes gene_type:complete